MKTLNTFNYYDLVIYAARNSSSARSLADAIGCRRWREGLYQRYSRRRPFFRGNNSPLIVNWGSTMLPRWLEDPRFRITPRYLNGFEKVACAIDKLKFFQTVSKYNEGRPRAERVPILGWTEDRSVAHSWLQGDKSNGVVVRRTTSGSSGRGIELVTRQAGSGVGVEEALALPIAPLYTRYYPKTHEFRVHVFKGEVIDFTQKRLKSELVGKEGVDRVVRSHDNGWVHAHEGTDLRQGNDTSVLHQACIRCVNEALGLDFGAVDVLAVLGPHDGTTGRPLKGFRICEVNTAPGLENTTTIEAYKTAILNHHKGTEANYATLG